MKKVLQILAPIGIVGVGVAGAAVLMALSGSAERAAAPPAPATVQVLTIQPATVNAALIGAGVVEADREITLTPQVGGEIAWVSPDLLPGGRFAEGEVLARIDSRDYQAALAQQEAALARAELDYKLELGRKATAEREWELLGDRQLSEAEAELALRGPQLLVAERNLASAEAAAQRASRDVGRTRLTAPFNAMVLSESVDVGQVVGATSAAARLVGTDRFRVTVSLPVEDLAALELPDADGAGGSRATITQRLGDGSTVQRSGRVLRIGGQLDPETRTAQVVVSVDRPLEGPGLPILPGAFVEAQIEGRALQGVAEVPRAAVSGGDTVWLVEGGALARREIVAGWSDDTHLYVTAGLAAGDQLVTTPLSLPIEGAPVQILAE